MPELPSGTVTFLFSDIEGSTRLLKELGEQYSDVLAEQQRILREAFAAHGGYEVDTQGDSFFVAFRRGKDAVAAAVDAQRDLAAHSWPEGAEVRVRMGLHTGEPQVGEERYVGLGVHKAARVGAAGHGGQVLLSNATRELVEDDLPTGVAIRDLGEHRLKDLERPERLAQLVIDGLPSEFGPLRTLDVELRRRRRRMYAGVALIGVLAAAIAVSAFAIGRGGGESGGDVEPNSVAAIDPDSNEVVAVVPVGDGPASLAVGGGKVWVVNRDAQTISMIDARSRALLRTFAVGAITADVAASGRSVWVGGSESVVLQLDPDRGTVVQTVAAPPLTPPPARPPLEDAGGVAVDGGTVWYLSGNATLSRIGARSGTVVARIRPHGLPRFLEYLAVGEGVVWVSAFASAQGGVLSGIDRRTNSVVHRVVLPAVGPVAAGFGQVWLAGGAVWVIDAKTGALVGTVAVPGGADDVAIGEGSVWVASAEGSVSRIDPTFGTVIETIRVGGRPQGIAVGAGAVWVAVG